MNIAKALAYYSLQIGQEPFATLIVKDGKIIASAHNEINTKKNKKDHKRHAEILAMERAAEKLKDEPLDGCTVYTTCAPCPQCAYQIRKYVGVNQVICGIDRKKSGVGILVDPDIKGIDDVGDPPVVIIGVLEDQLNDFYEKNGCKDMIRYVGRRRVIIEPSVRTFPFYRGVDLSKERIIKAYSLPNFQGEVLDY